MKIKTKLNHRIFLNQLKLDMKKATLNLRAKLRTNVAKLFALLLVFLLGNLPLSMAQNNVILASANQNRSFQAKSTYALKEVLTDIGEHYKVKIAYETDLVRDLTVSDYPRFSSQDVVVVLKKVPQIRGPRGFLRWPLSLHNFATSVRRRCRVTTFSNANFSQIESDKRSYERNPCNVTSDVT